MQQGEIVKSKLDNVFTVKEVAEILRCHANSVYQLVEQKKIKAIRIGKKIIISENALNEFING
jgi:excisionase family DNA binding protein